MTNDSGATAQIKLLRKAEQVSDDGACAAGVRLRRSRPARLHAPREEEQADRHCCVGDVAEVAAVGSAPSIIDQRTAARTAPPSAGWASLGLVRCRDGVL